MIAYTFMCLSVCMYMPYIYLCVSHYIYVCVCIYIFMCVSLYICVCLYIYARLQHDRVYQRSRKQTYRDCEHTGWRRLIGSTKLQIIFHKRGQIQVTFLQYRSLLRKITYKDKGSCESSPRCSSNIFTMIAYQYVFVKIIGLFCRISSLVWGSFAKETYDFKEPTNRSHLIAQTY